MSQSVYERKITVNHLIYYIAFTTCILLAIILLILIQLDYLVLLGIILLFIELFLHPQIISISKETLTIKSTYIGGLFKKTTFIHLASIQKIHRASSDIQRSFTPDFDDVIWPGYGTPELDLFQISYKSTDGSIIRKSIRLYLNEYTLLKENIQ